MKRIATITLTAVLALGMLSGCGSKADAAPREAPKTWKTIMA